MIKFHVGKWQLIETLIKWIDLLKLTFMVQKLYIPSDICDEYTFSLQYMNICYNVRRIFERLLMFGEYLNSF